MYGMKLKESGDFELKYVKSDVVVRHSIGIIGHRLIDKYSWPSLTDLVALSKFHLFWYVTSKG